MAERMIRTWRSADGVTLVGDEAGDPAAPAVVLLHGGGQTRHSWAGTMQLLVSQGYHVLNFDARGHGDSGWSEAGAYHLDDRVADLKAVAADCRAGIALVGASLGGATALHAAASGLAVSALVLVDIVPDPEPDGVDRIIHFMCAHGDGFATLDEAADAVAAYNPARPRSADPRGLMRNLRPREGRLYWHWDPKIMAPEVRAQMHDVVRGSAARIGANADLPLLLVRGLKSDVVSDAGVAAFRALAPRLEVADVSGAGHMVAGDRNDAFGDGVIDFLGRHMPPVHAPTY